MTNEILCPSCTGSGLRANDTYEYDKNGNLIVVKAISTCPTCLGAGKIRA